ncbi:protoporphyrinogen oxidase [Caulobacter rhizosphaerae]|uniref:Protoporphyrinogen oxidase n=1 Tax=Caulobacter rhizosphaerae TaxID=2010972 RepID=A0ABU1N7V9_9CAUL|nr:FAD-dependent oxidoreductase [Caulobacter rhizosphaerae]MDR6533971.1 protoporphyrinogen oxidase [Caulobacter rhizosphaerae]
MAKFEAAPHRPAGRSLTFSGQDGFSNGDHRVMGQHVETLVIGAGPAGLTAAYVLAKAGRDVAVLEMDPHAVGGSSRTIDHHGFKIDLNGGAYASTSPAVLALWSELLPDGFVEQPRTARIYHRERFYAYPLKALEALGLLGLRGAAACLASFGLAKIRPIKAPRTFGDEIRNRFGARLSSTLFLPFAEKVSGLIRDQMPAGRAGAARPAASLRYPRLGGGSIWRTCADQIAAFGGEVALGRRVETLKFDPITRSWAVTILRDDGAHEVRTADHVVSTAPLRELMAMLRPAPISLFHAGELMYRDQITVALVGRTRKPLREAAIDVHDTDLQVGRVQNYRAWSPDMAPEGEAASCLGLDYFCFEGDGLWTASDADLVALAWREAAVMGLMDPTAVSDARVVRQRKVLPIEDEDCAEHRAMIRLDLKMQFPSLHLAGRNGLHRDGARDQATLSGLMTAENILTGETAHDVWEVSAPPPAAGRRAA